ncbi:3959_t:CDS:1, partial [Racocetra persica]
PVIEFMRQHGDKIKMNTLCNHCAKKDKLNKQKTKSAYTKSTLSLNNDDKAEILIEDTDESNEDNETGLIYNLCDLGEL